MADIYRIGACGVIIAIILLLKISHSNQRKRRVWIREWINGLFFLLVVKERSIFIKFQFDCFLRCPRVYRPFCHRRQDYTHVTAESSIIDRKYHSSV